MCEVLSENLQCPIISSPSLSEKETIAQGSNEDEKNKDSAPEVIGKPDSFKTVPAPLLNKLASGVLSIYVNDMKKSSLSLAELTRNQTIVIETLEQENGRVEDALKTYPLEEMFSKVKQYHVKVQLLRKEMLAIHERTTKLKKRAMKLQQQKQKEALQKELQRDRDLERDKQLAPKFASKSMPAK